METPAEGERAGWPVTRLARANGEVCLIHYFLNVSLSLNAHACYLGKREVRRITSPGDLFGCPVSSRIPVAAGRMEVPGGAVRIDDAERRQQSVRTIAQERMRDFMVGNYAYGTFETASGFVIATTRPSE